MEMNVVPGGRRRAPAAGAVVVLAGLLFGAGALAAGIVAPDGLRLLLAGLVLFAGWLFGQQVRAADEQDQPVVSAATLRGVGGGLAVLGAYLLGLGMLGLVAEAQDYGEAPSPLTVVLVLYGALTVLVLAMSLAGQRAWHAPAGVLLVFVPVLAFGTEPFVVAVVALVVAAVLTAVVLRLPAGHGPGNVFAAAAAMAATIAYGAGASPLGALGATQSGPTTDNLAAGAAAPSGLLMAAALLVALVQVLLALARRDVASGLLAGSVFLAAPVAVLVPLTKGSASVDGATLLALAAAPLALAVLAAIAIAAHPLRHAVARLVRALGSGRTPSAAAAVAILVVALGVLVVLVLPLAGLPGWLRGTLALLMLLLALLSAGALRGTAGVSCAVLGLLCSRLASPWQPFLLGTQTTAGLSPSLLLASAVLDLVFTGVLVVLLVGMHRHSAIYAAAAYTMIGALAGIIAAPSYAALVDFSSATDYLLVLMVGLPLAVLGLPAAVAAFRHPSIGQSIGAVVLVSAALLPMKLAAIRLGGADTGTAISLSLGPLTPSDPLGLIANALMDETAALIAIVALGVLTLVLAVTLAGRPSPALAAAVGLSMLVVTQAVLLGVDYEVTEVLAWCLGAVGLVAAAVAAGVLSRLSRGGTRSASA